MRDLPEAVCVRAIPFSPRRAPSAVTLLARNPALRNFLTENLSGLKRGNLLRLEVMRHPIEVATITSG
jgi:hypothetical protein